MNQTNVSREVLDFFLNGQFAEERIVIIDVIVISLHVINFLSGFGNLFLCVLIPMKRVLRTPFNAFLVLLSISCLVTNLVVSPLELAPRISLGYVTPETRPSRWACITNVYLRTCSFMTSMVVTVMVSILRLMAIISPIKFRNLETLTVVIACCAAGGLSFLVAVPSVGIRGDTVLVQLCQWSGSPGDAQKDSSWWIYALIIVIVQATVIGCYVSIGILLRRRNLIIAPVINHQSATHNQVDSQTHPIQPKKLPLQPTGQQPQVGNINAGASTSNPCQNFNAGTSTSNRIQTVAEIPPNMNSTQNSGVTVDQLNMLPSQSKGQQPQAPAEVIPTQEPEFILDPVELVSQSPPALDIVKNAWTSNLNLAGSFESGMSSLNQGGNIDEGTSTLNPGHDFDAGISTLNPMQTFPEIPTTPNSTQNSCMTLDTTDGRKWTVHKNSPQGIGSTHALPKPAPNVLNSNSSVTILTMRVGIIVSATIFLFLLIQAFISMLETRDVFSLKNDGNLIQYPRRQLAALQNALACFSSAVHPLTYTITSSVFRSEVKKFFVRACSFRNLG